MKTLYTVLLLIVSGTTLATTPAEYGQYVQDSWERVCEEAKLNKAPVPSKAAWEKMTQRDESSIDHNGGKIIRYQDQGRVYYDYSENNAVK